MCTIFQFYFQLISCRINHRKIYSILSPSPLLHFPACSYSYFDPISSLLSISIEGKEALRNINKKMGLGFDDWDLEFYTKMFTEQLMRNPTDVECFDLGKNCLFWENSYSYSCWCLCVGVGACAISMLTPLSLFLDLPVNLAVHLSLCLFVCLSLCLPVSLSVFLPV